MIFSENCYDRSPERLLLADRKAAAMIVGMPNGRAQKNDRAGGDVFRSAPAYAAFEQDLLKDVIPAIESRYSVQADRAKVEESIKQYAALGLKVLIAELDIGVLPTRYRGADVSGRPGRGAGQGSAMNPCTDGLPDAVAPQHAERYRQAFAMFLRHKDVIGRVTFRGTHDGRSWLNNFPIRGRTDYPLLFDREGKPKPAFFAVLKLGQGAKI